MVRFHMVRIRKRCIHFNHQPSFFIGPCQFPTLGFVVSRYNQVKAFVPESCWFIHLSHERPKPGGGREETVFNWKRNHLFEEPIVAAIYEGVMEQPRARVTKVTQKTTKKWYALADTAICTLSLYTF
jgi:DNA topoisomerase III